MKKLRVFYNSIVFVVFVLTVCILCGPFLILRDSFDLLERMSNAIADNVSDWLIKIAQKLQVEE